MMRSTVKRLIKPLGKPEREFRRLKKAAMHSHQNESLVIVRRNLLDDEASSSNNTRAKLPTPPKTLHEHSRLNSFGFQNPITFPTEQTRRIIDSRDIWLIQSTYTFQGWRNEDPLRHVKHYLSIVDNIQADRATRDTSRLRFFHFSLKRKVTEWLDRIPPTQITTWDKLVSRFLDHFFPVGCTSALRDLILRFKQGDDEPIKIPLQLSYRRRRMESNRRIRLVPRQSVGRTINIHELLFHLRSNATYTHGAFKKGSHEADEWEQNNSFEQNDDTSPWGNSKRKEKGEDSPEWIVRSKFEDELANFMLEKKSHEKGIKDILVQHQAEKDDEDERLLSIFKQIHINLSFLEAMIHMPKGANVLKDLLSHKEKLKKTASSVKLSEECSAIIQRSLPKRKETREVSHCHASLDPR
ncbi:DNA-directed DNA polymerase, partial [Tanacetum coccineum]